MRALVVHPGPNFSVADVHNGWVKGLQANGVETISYNLDARLSMYAQAHIQRDGDWLKLFTAEEAAQLASKGIEAACYEWWPDLVVIVSGFYVPPFTYKLLRARGHKVVILHTESPYEDSRQLERAPFADLNLLNDPTNLEQFQAVSNAVYMPHAYDPDIHFPQEPDPDLRSDFCFVGTGYPSRIEFLEAVDWTGIDVAIGGNWGNLDPDSPLLPFLVHDRAHCCPNEETARLYAATKASVNLYRREALTSELEQGWAMGPREVELAATGVFFLRDPRGEGDEVLPMLPTFTGPEDFGEQLRWWLAHDDAREEAARQAQAAVADRTFTNHAARLLTLL